MALLLEKQRGGQSHMKKFSFSKSHIGQTVWIPNGQLIINPNRIRKKFSDDVVDDLVKTFKNNPKYPDEFPDVIVPVIGGQPNFIDDKMMVGIHNTITMSFQKARRDPREEIRVKFVEYRDMDELLLQSYKENEDRGSLDVVDRARYLTKLKETLKTDENVAKYIGKSEQYVQKLIAVDRLPDDIKSKIAVGKGKGKIQLIFANMIFALREKGFDVQKKFSNIVEDYDPSIREAQELSKSLRDCPSGHENAILEQFKKKFMAKQNLGAIEKTFSKQQKNMPKEKKPSLEGAASDFAHYFTEASAGMQTLLSDLSNLDSAVGKHSLEDLYNALGSGDKKRVRDSIKSFRFCKKKLIEYLEEPLSKKLEVLP